MKFRWICTSSLLIPYLILLFRSRMCGWDCPYYVYHLGMPLSEMLLKIEPLYFILFKPFSYIFSELAVVKISLILTILLALAGVYLLTEKFKMNAKERMFALAAFAFSGATISMWFNLLRNFLALTITPFFLYFYFGDRKRDHAMAIILLTLIGIAHRTSVILIAAVGLHLLYTKKYKLLLAYVVGMVPLGVYYLYTLTGFITLAAGSSAVGGSSLVNVGILLGNLANVARYVFAPGFAILPALFYIILRRKPDPKAVFMYILIAVSILASIPLDHIFVSRPLFQMVLPFSILAGLGLREMIRRGTRFMRIMVAVSLVGMVGAAAYATIDVGTDLTDEEMAFIESMEIPEGSTVILPGRMLFYTKYVWGDRYALHPLIPDPYLPYDDEALWAAYRGENTFGYDVYVVDVNPERPGNLPVLKLLPA